MVKQAREAYLIDIFTENSMENGQRSNAKQPGDSNIAWIAGIGVSVGVAVILAIVLTVTCFR